MHYNNSEYHMVKGKEFVQFFLNKEMKNFKYDRIECLLTN